MSTSQVIGAWPRIEQWLAASAPGQLASLRPGASPAAVAAAQQQLGLRFPEDLAASLERHDGAATARGHFTVYGPFRPVTLADLVTRHQETEPVMAEFEDYWDRHYLAFTATNSDWHLLVDCAPGDTFGRVGVWFGGEGVRWPGWPSLGALLTEVADALGTGRPVDRWVPVAFGGDLEWKLASEPVTRELPSVLTLAAAAREPEPETAPAPDPVVAGAPGFAWIALPVQPGGRPEPRRRGPSSEPGWTGPYSPSSCLTFVAGIGPDELLRRFGVGAPEVPVPRETASLTADEAYQAEHSWRTGHLPVVRAGQAGRWSFAFEDGHHEGLRAPVLPRLSAGTQAVALYFWGPELAILRDETVAATFYGQDSLRLGGREPGLLAGPLTREGILPWDRFRPRHENVTALLAVLRAELGIEFDPDVLAGPLPGGPFLPQLPDRAVVTRGVSVSHGGPVAALIQFAAPGRLQQALLSQARALAAETGLTGYPEIATALDRLAAGEDWSLTGDSPLGLRFRLLAAENAAAGRRASWEHSHPELTTDDKLAWTNRFWAAEAIMELITGPPQRAARFVLGQRQDPNWPHRFAADLGPVAVLPGAAARIAQTEAEEDTRAHVAGAGYQVPVWPSARNAWVAQRAAPDSA
ncbi:MAG TPA: SMI1/KNR4 family protein [Streptosporangiaceae bacterium]